MLFTSHDVGLTMSQCHLCISLATVSVIKLYCTFNWVSQKFKVQNILLSLDQKFHLDLLTLT